MKWIWITFVVLISETHSIQTRTQRLVRFTDQDALPSRNFRHIEHSSNINFDWEHGLREATVQTLFREQVGDHNIRKHVYSAPLLGKQDKATPFGDIAILARGQLYANYAGYIFVQDPYQNDCDDCHSIDAEALRGRCINNHCQIWHPRSNEQLIALWSIKRIRHRSSRDGFNRLEIEFTIAPVGLRHPKAGYLTKEGTFNYNLPGHVFILKTSEAHQNLDSVQNVNHFKHGAFVAQTPDGRKYILHSFPGILTPDEIPHPTSTNALPTRTTTAEEDPKKLYQTLLEVLHKKTSLEPNRFIPPTRKTSTIIPDTTLVQLPDGQVVPVTDLETPFVTKATPGYVSIRFPETPSSKKPEEQSTIPIQRLPPTTQSIAPTTSQIQTQPPSSTKQTTSRDFFTIPQQTTFFAPPTTSKFTPQTPHEVYNKPKPIYTKPTTANTVQYYTTTQETTQAPVKMTFHFFAAEEENKSSSETPKKSLTTLLQSQQTENEVFLPTKPTKVFPLEATKYEIDTTQRLKPTTKYQEATINPYTTFSSARPATVIKVTKPITETTYTYHTTEPSTKIIPSTLFEPSTTTYYTTKKPYSGFTIPITVLENTDAETTSQEKYPTTRTGEAFSITQTPEASTRTPSIEYTNIQFYHPTTTKLAPEQSSTTILQATTTLSEPTLDTTYAHFPTLVTDKGTIETTLGVTKFMGTSQNKTTEMIYYAAEDTEVPSSSIPSTTSVTSTEPTNVILETESMSTPKRIVTTIGADGKISVKTTPLYAEEELFGLTKGSTKTPKTTKSYKASSTEPSDFLVEDGPSQDSKVPLFKKPLKDYNEDDIFGTTKSTSNTPKKTEITKEYVKSDIEQALFDNNNRKGKGLRRRKSSTTESTPSKVLYSNFFEASTLAMTTPPQVTTLPSVEFVAPSITERTVPISKTTTVKARKSFSVSKRPKFGISKVGRVSKQEHENEKVMAVTSQSYLTSISYEVNKIKKPLSDQSSERTQLENENKGEGTKMMKRIDNIKQIKQVKGIDNDFALRLVSQAKGVEYLDKISTTSASTISSTIPKTTKTPKYQRHRTYVPIAKRQSRKKSAKNTRNR